MTNIRVQKIDGTTLKTYKMIVFTFSVLDKDIRKSFFEKSFLLANIKSDVILGMPFLTINDVNNDFQAQDLQ